MKELIFLIPLFPLLGFLVNGLFWKRIPKSISGILACVMLLIAFGLSLGVFLELRQDPTPYLTTLFPFINVSEVSIPFALQVDTLSATFLLFVTGVGFLIHVYSLGYMKEDEGFNRYFAYLNFFVFAMLILVLGANYLMMFIGWEGVGLASYLLIGFWFKNKDYTDAGKKSFIMNRIGDMFFIIAMMLLVFHYNTLDFNALTNAYTENPLNTDIFNWIAICLFIGAIGKSAQIPLYTWLPDAMAGPTPVSALIHAATMVTAGIYMVARSSALYNLAPLAQDIVAIIGLATAFLAATIALKQYDIKKVLAYSTVSQLGFMFLALGVGSYVGGVFHVVTHAFFKALLFLGAGSVIHSMGGEQDIRAMGGLKKKMPVTHFTFLIACLAIAGIPGFSGFFSKDEILAATYAKSPFLYVIAIVTSMMTAYYMFRLYFLTFAGRFRGTADQGSHLHESPATMTIPLIVLAILSVVGGYIGLPAIFSDIHKMSEWLSSSVSNFNVEHLSHSLEWTLMIVAAVGAIIMIFWAYYNNKSAVFKENTGLSKMLEHKWYVDEIYDKTIVKPLYQFGGILSRYFENKTIDGFVNGMGRFANWSGAKVRLLQSGQIGNYMFGFVIGIVILFLIAFIPFYK